MDADLKITTELRASIAEKRLRAVELLKSRRSGDTNPEVVLSSLPEPEIKNEDKGEPFVIPESCSQFLDTGEVCGAPVDSIMAVTFGEAVCTRCKFKHEDFEVVSKEVAKKEYMLTDFSLSTVKHLSKPNPHNASWSHIKLFLRKHLKDRAAVRWGSLENMNSKRQTREQRKYECAVKKVGELFEAKERGPVSGSPDRDCVAPKQKKAKRSVDVSALAAIVRGDNL